MKPWVTFELGKDEALILSELLQDFSNQDSVPVTDVASRLALLRLHGAFERTLVELFMPNYKEQVEEAKLRLRTEYGVTQG